MKIVKTTCGSALLCAALNFNPAFAADPTNAVVAATPAATNAPAGGARRGGPPGPPATAEDIAQMAKLNDLPNYASGLGDGDYSVGPDYAPAPEQAEREGIPHGKIIQFTMDSTESKFWPGTNGGFKRDVAVYVPAQYVPGTAAPVIVSCDRYGLSPRTGLIKNTLDNMIADHRLPVMVAVMVNPGPQRSVEYDTVSSKYADFVEAEVLPRAEKEAGITITKDPEGRMAYGGSSGGVAAFTMAWFHPERYHRVLSYSGTYVNLQRSAEVPHGAWEYNEHLIPNSPAKPLRVWMEVAQNDNGAATAASNFRNWVLANQNMATVMKAKGYHYQLVYAKNAGHTDGKVIAQTFPQALEFLWKGYPIEPAK